MSTYNSAGNPSGYSYMYEDPQVLRTLQKHRRMEAVISLAAGVLLLAGCVIYGAVSKKLGLAVGLMAGVVCLIICIFIAAFRLLKGKPGTPFEGIIKDKRIGTRERNDIREKVYTLVIEKEDGKTTKRDCETECFHYFEIGDRLRVHPGFPNPFEAYEKRDGVVLCAFCSHPNDMNGNTCGRCKKILVR